MTAPRLPRFTPESLNLEQSAVYESIVGGPRGQGPQLFPLRDDDGALAGPFNAFLLQPSLGAALQAVGSAVRYHTSLTDRAREIAILVVAMHWESAFEWHAHAALGRHVGLTDDELSAIRDGQHDRLPPAERLVAATAQCLVADGDLDDTQYREAVAALGEPILFELLTLVGYYAMLALQMRVFRTGSPGRLGA